MLSPNEETPLPEVEVVAVDINATAPPLLETPISCPLVLQCLQCRTIVGDTCSVVSLDPALRTIILQKKGENASLQNELHTSQGGVDYGSTFHLVECKKCGAALGRMYRTTPPELDQWRGHYTFNSDALTFYELSGELMRPLNVAEPSSSQSSAVDSNVNLEITKLQKFCLYLYERMTRLEEQVKNNALNLESQPKDDNRTFVVDRRPVGRPRKETALHAADHTP